MALRMAAADLRARREAAGVSLAGAAQSLGVHQDTVRRMESAETALRHVYVESLLRAYGTAEPDIKRVLEVLHEANKPGWWHEFRDVLPDHLQGTIDLESAANMIRVYAPQVLPELLQTPDYARAMLRLTHPREPAERTERRIELLAERKRRAFERPRPLRLWALIEESALNRPVGGAQVMRAQRESLARMVADPMSPIAVQVVMPDGGPHPLLTSGPAELMRFEHPALADRAVVRGLHPEVTVHDGIDVVRTFQAAMDTVSIVARPPRTPLPPARGAW
ncbi:helix-turn-helix domain-containing protein [Streptomyces sp. NPDC050560]|uniref:helix-turn-helix domain-containing protein n=1 Tax=Streptomyces sp. NPDC050560 TaxID=3365630 RepID=UPI0037B205BA